LVKKVGTHQSVPTFFLIILCNIGFIGLKVVKENQIGSYFIVSIKCLCYDFLDERFCAFSCGYRYSDNRCFITHDRASRRALGWISNLVILAHLTFVKLRIVHKWQHDETILKVQRSV